MNVENLQNQISELEKNIENLKYELEKAKNEPECQNKNFDNIEAARRIKTIYSCYSQGMTAWEIAEYIKDELGASVWGAYDFVNCIIWKEREKIKFAKNYLIKSLYKSGFKKSEISKIAGLSQQRCGQIVKKGVFKPV